jgi:hypothetical protein
MAPPRFLRRARHSHILSRHTLARTMARHIGSQCLQTMGHTNIDHKGSRDRHKFAGTLEQVALLVHNLAKLPAARKCCLAAPGSTL